MKYFCIKRKDVDGSDLKLYIRNDYLTAEAKQDLMMKPPTDKWTFNEMSISEYCINLTKDKMEKNRDGNTAFLLEFYLENKDENDQAARLY